MELSYEEIRRIHLLEKNTSQLVEVQGEFYEELHDFLKNEKQKYLESLKNFSVSNTRDFTNLKKMVEEVFSMREKKILSKALIASRTKEVTDMHMANPEKKIFKEILILLERHNSLLQELFETKQMTEQSKEKNLDQLNVKILSEVPSFVGYDMKEYGPFEKGEVVSVPLKIGKLLNSRKLGQIEDGV